MRNWIVVANVEILDWMATIIHFKWPNSPLFNRMQMRFLSVTWQKLSEWYVTTAAEYWIAFRFYVIFNESTVWLMTRTNFRRYAQDILCFFGSLMYSFWFYLHIMKWNPLEFIGIFSFYLFQEKICSFELNSCLKNELCVCLHLIAIAIGAQTQRSNDPC